MWFPPQNFYYPFADYPYLDYSPFPPSTGPAQVQSECKLVAIAPKKHTYNIELDQKLVLGADDLREVEYDPKKRDWTFEEDRMLLFLKKKLKLNWDAIADKMKGRNKKRCYSRYKRIKNRCHQTMKPSE